MPTTWLITGASRGIGFGLVRRLLSSPENVVFASCRNPAGAGALHALAGAGPGTLHVVQLDTADAGSIASAAAQVGGLLGGRALDYVVNNAGVMLRDDSPLTLAPAAFLETLTTNVLGPALVLQHFVPFLERSARPVVLNMSSGLGSIGSDMGVVNTSYSVSKAALNMLTYKFAKEKPNIIAIAMTPGWVKTDMGGNNAPIELEDSVTGTLSLLASLELKDSGTFKRYNGQSVSW